MKEAYKFVYNGPALPTGEEGTVMYEFKTGENSAHWYDIHKTFLVFLSSVYGYEITSEMVVKNAKFWGDVPKETKEEA